MRHLKTLAAMFTAATVAVTGGCGGGGHGFTVATDPIVITSTALPATLSGEVINIPLVFSGGYGGPYLISTLIGSMPPGVTTNNATTAFTGRPLADGTFHFTLQLTDTGGSPFATTTADYTWVVGQGPLVFATDTVLPSIIYGTFSAVLLQVAGGVPPYECSVVNNPLDPIDELLPLGMSIPASSTSIVGSPLSAKVGGAPFHVTIRARDHNNPADPLYGSPNTVDKRFDLAILVPPIIIATTSIANGKCGTTFSEHIDIVDGIPPFLHQVVQALSSTTALVGEPGAPDNLALTPKGTFPCAYPTDADASATYAAGRFPEGITLGDSTGDLTGSSRRKGTFNWFYMVQSQALPADPTQNKWKAFTFSFTDAAPPVFALDPSVTTGGSFTPPNNRLPDMEIAIAYNPDGGPTGLQMKALPGAGVAQDGKWDSPKLSQATAHISGPGAETAGAFVWSSPSVLPVGMSFTAAGVFVGTPTVRQGFQNAVLTASDVQLPLAATHVAGGTVQVAVGPDAVIITESSNASGTGGYPFIDATYDRGDQTVEVFEPYSGTPSVRVLSDGVGLPTGSTSPSDQASGGTTLTNPSLRSDGTNGGKSLLSDTLKTIDIQRVGIIPTTWHDDNYQLNAQGARSWQHSDPDRKFTNEAIGGDVYQKYVTGTQLEGADFTSNSAIELPQTTAVVTNKVTGVYADGGLMYAFDNANCFGFFVVRSDGKIYIPCAFNKSGAASPFLTTGAALNPPTTGVLFQGFGDGNVTTTTTGNSRLRMLSMSVSPNGRFAAVKLKQNIANFVETANTSRICLFSLTGEKVFDNGGGANTSPFKVITTGGSGGLSDGRFLYGDTLTLTNTYLYWLQGNYIGYDTGTSTINPQVIHCDHWVYRYTVLGGAAGGALLNPGASFTATTWTNNTTAGAVNLGSSALSTTYHRWVAGAGAGSYSNVSSYQPTRGANTGNGTTYVSPDYFVYSWANTFETSMAPTPFRVSVDGRTCAIVAGPNNQFPTSATYANFSYFIYVDFFDPGTASSSFRNTQPTVTPPVHSATLASTTMGTAKHYGGARRMGGCACGEELNQMYGWYQGPATQLEVSDDGQYVAAVYNNPPTATTLAMAESGSYWTSYREDISLFTGTGASTNWWTSTSETLVTGGATPRFSASNSIIWRFGCLAFTRDNGALVFFGGTSGYCAVCTGTTYLDPAMLLGTFWGYDISAVSLTEILATADGGPSTGITGYSTASPFNPAYASSFSTLNYYGLIEPQGAFYSNDGKFLWIETWGGLSSTDSTNTRLIGINVSARTANTINGRVALRGFRMTAQDNTYRGFGMSMYAYYPGTRIKGGVGGPTSHGATQQVSCANHKGLVFYVSHFNFYNNLNGNQYNYITTGDLGGGQVYPISWFYGQGYYAAEEVYGFDSSVGGEPFALTSLNTGGTGSPNNRLITHIQPNRAGSRLLFAANVATTSYWGHDGAQEQPYAISNIATNATTGVLSGSPVVVALESSPGRLGPSVAMDSTDSKMFYAFAASASNEAGMKLTEKTFSPSGSVTNTRTSNGVSGTTARFAVLWSGR